MSLAPLTAFQRTLVAAGIRAPSGDNCQPWRFRFTGTDQILIDIHPEQAESFFDYHHGPTFLSVGAVVENIRIQAAALGYAAEVAYPGGVGPGHPSAVITLHPDSQISCPSTRLQALHRRTVNRRPFLPWALAPRDIEHLTAEPILGTKVHLIQEWQAMGRWTRLIYLADRIRLSHPQIHTELFAKILFQSDAARGVRVGLETNRFGLGPGAEPILRFLKPWSRIQQLSRWGLLHLLAGQSQWLAQMSGGLVLVTIPTSTPEYWMRAGEQTQRLWIRAEELGLAVHPMTVALYLDQRYQEEGLRQFLPAHAPLLGELTRTLTELLDGQRAAMLFRIGKALPMREPASRMAIEDFLPPAESP